MALGERRANSVAPPPMSDRLDGVALSGEAIRAVDEPARHRIIAGISAAASGDSPPELALLMLPTPDGDSPRRLRGSRGGGEAGDPGLYSSARR